VQPDIAVFGDKDYQQLQIIRRMTNDLSLPIRIVGVETVREANGLAMSSRNQYLSDEERKTAAKLYGILVDVVAGVKERMAHAEPGVRDFHDIEQQAMQALQVEGFRPEYLKVCYADDLADAELTSAKNRELRVLAAAWLGKARLIDNLPVTLA
jgi:pantoate--beta-alanine ligase